MAGNDTIRALPECPCAVRYSPAMPAGTAEPMSASPENPGNGNVPEAESSLRRFFRLSQAPKAAAPAPDFDPDSLTLPHGMPAITDAQLAAAGAAPAEGSTLLLRMKSGLARTRSVLASGIVNVLVGKKEIDDEIFEEIETQLLVADVGVEATRRIIDNLTGRVSRNELIDADALYDALQDELVALLQPVEAPLLVDRAHRPYVVLVVGVNGVGKTTTIGKLAKRQLADGHSVLLAAGDTFRAAAVEQLQVWGERNNVPVIAQHTGADSASVCYDALAAAQSRGVDLLIADTAGRLQNKAGLMDELRKVKRVMGKLDPSAPHEVLLVIDAGTGQNAINQVREFNEAVGVTGLVVTKLDGTAKGGILFALAEKFGIPIRYVGVGEKIGDLRVFNARAYVSALFSAD
ncbi:MAG: signal recognition particle-docking protein FtsY [Gammaproteobacteria bacterium]